MWKENRYWTVTPVFTGKFGMVRDDIRYRGGDPSVVDYVPSVLFLLEKGERQVVVDTGFGEARECAEQLSLFVERKKSYEEILTEAGIDREKVEAVIFTHLHWDHAGNAGSFSNAVFYCHEKEWDRAVGYPDEYPEIWMEDLKRNNERIRLIREESEKEIFPGIRVRYAGGHTYGSQMVLVDTAQGLAVITGDVVMTEKNVRESLPVGLCVNHKECEEVLKVLAGLKPARIYPSHDFSIFEKG